MPTSNYGVYGGNYNYFQVIDMDVRNANHYNVYFDNCDQVKVIDCDFNDGGIGNVYFSNCASPYVYNFTAYNGGSKNILVRFCSNAIVRKFTADSSHIIIGSTQDAGSSGANITIYEPTGTTYVDSGFINNSGYSALNIENAGGVITRALVIDGYCVTTDDNGGIYLIDNAFKRRALNYIYDIIIKNGIGGLQGYPATITDHQSHPLYFDRRNWNARANNITVINAPRGIIFNSSQNVSVTNSTFFNVGEKEIYLRGYYKTANANEWMDSITLTGNISFALRGVTAGSKSMLFVTEINDSNGVHTKVNNYGVMDSNYFAHPFSASSVAIVYNDGSNNTLSQWRTAFPQYDAASVNFSSSNRPLLTTTTADCVMAVNETDHVIDYPLNYAYTNVKGTVYPYGYIRLQPYSGMPLMRSGAVIPEPPIITEPVDNIIKIKLYGKKLKVL